MTQHKYSIFAGFIYRYANLPLTAFLFIYLLASIASIFHQWYFIFPSIINAIVIYLMNKYYLRNYKTMPFHIKIDNEKISVSKFTGKREPFTFTIAEIEDIQGGIFSGSQTKPIHIFIRGKDLPITFNIHISKFNELLTTVLKNIDQKLYDTLLDQIKAQNRKFAEMIRGKNKNARK